MDPLDPQLWEVSFSEDGVEVTSSGGFDVVGGTGRFQGATGRVHLTSSRVGTGDTTSGFTGTIS